MNCAYCNEKTSPTREHIISSCVLDLFPECNLTIDSSRNKVYPADPVVNDVCAKCNNQRLSYIDTYAKEFISRYFVKKYTADTKLQIEYNYTLLQKVLLKYTFNALRAEHKDVSFFDSRVKHFLLNENSVEPLSDITVLAGLAVNVSPLPDFLTGNQKIRWSSTPAFLIESLIDVHTHTFDSLENNSTQSFDGLKLSYIFRFNSGEFIIMCWDTLNPKSVESQKIIQRNYPFTILPPDKSEAQLVRCTDTFTYNMFPIIQTSIGQGVSDIIWSEKTHRQKDFWKEAEVEWNAEEERIKKENPRK